MDVNKGSFYPLILDILTDISEAHFVSLDLELSGVPSKDSWSKGGAGKPTLQERYLEVKEAAEKYQILQIGLTCVEQNLEDGNYVLKPYNFDLSPVITERLDVERVFSFQSGAAEFLLGVGFDFQKPFTQGVPYLSRAETQLAREKFAKRQERSTIVDIQIKPTETESLAFLQRTRDGIDAWVKTRSINAKEYINISSEGFEDIVDGERQGAELSKYERRLVHQLVRAEYPELVTINKRGFIQVIKFDREREERIAAGRERDNEERIGRQKGFRWIIEALLGNDISKLDLKLSAVNSVTGESIFADLDDYKAQFNRAQTLMRRNPKILVGHNCFLDMVYIYKTFIGDLPPTVGEFQERLHELWPMVIDTKYMSTHNCGDINPVSSLEQIASQMRAQQIPKVVLDQQHSKYRDTEILHEAGFDSYLTAQIAVLLSAKLEREGAYIDVERRGSEVPQDITNGVANMKVNGDGSEPALKQQKKSELNGGAEGFVPSEVGGKWKRGGEPTLGPAAEGDPFKYDPKDRKHRHVPQDITLPDGMPRFRSDFWRVYGNKLRVFGTEEGVCVLDGGAETPSSSDDGGVGV